MNKKIEEIARTLCSNFGTNHCKVCDHHERCMVRLDAEWIYSAGYLKQVEGEWEQFGLRNPKCSLCRGYNTEKSNFCPNCGAKMKGE